MSFENYLRKYITTDKEISDFFDQKWSYIHWRTWEDIFAICKSSNLEAFCSDLKDNEGFLY